MCHEFCWWRRVRVLLLRRGKDGEALTLILGEGRAPQTETGPGGFKLTTEGQ